MFVLQFCCSYCGTFRALQIIFVNTFFWERNDQKESFKIRKQKYHFSVSIYYPVCYACCPASSIVWRCYTSQVSNTFSSSAFTKFAKKKEEKRKCHICSQCQNWEFYLPSLFLLLIIAYCLSEHQLFLFSQVQKSFLDNILLFFFVLFFMQIQSSLNNNQMETQHLEPVCLHSKF